MTKRAAFTATISIAICLAGVSCQQRNNTRSAAASARASQPANPSGMSGVAPITIEGSKTNPPGTTTSAGESSTAATFTPPPRPATPASRNGELPLAFAQAQPEDSAPRVPIGTVEQLLAKNDVVVVDVRDPADYEASHAKGAINIPLSEITNLIDKLPHDKMIVAYCT